MDQSRSTAMTMVTKEQKDADLDKRIEAMRKKNEVLMKRYQEVEEDKKQAEQEGMAMHGRKSKIGDLTITINKSPTEKRVVTNKGLGDTIPKGVQNQDDVSNILIVGHGKRRQILVTAPGNTKGKRVVSERVEKSSSVDLTGIKHSTGGKTKPLNTSTRKKDCLKSQQAEILADLSVPTSSEEKLEYLRWKKEREEIDRERVARHKNSQGQWRRAWDVDKPELTFSEKGATEKGGRGGRNAKRGHFRPSAMESRGGQLDKRGKNVPVIGSKVNGKDRLTGRARRWDTKEEAENLQVTADSSLEEFLKELNSLCDPEVNSNSSDTETQKAEFSSSMEMATTTSCVSIHIKSESQIISTGSSNKNTFSSRLTEKKVRFSDDLIQGAFTKNPSTDPQAALPSIKELKPTPESLLAHETERTFEDTPCDSVVPQNSSEAPENSNDQNLLHTIEPPKNNSSRNTDKLTESLPVYSTSAEKARENGIVV